MLYFAVAQTRFMSLHKAFFYLQHKVLQMSCFKALRFFPPNLHHQLQTLASWYVFSSTMALFAALAKAETFFPLYIMRLSWKNLSWQIKGVMRPHGNSSQWLFFLHRFFFICSSRSNLARSESFKKRNTARFQICKSNSGRTARLEARGTAMTFQNYLRKEKEIFVDKKKHNTLSFLCLYFLSLYKVGKTK